MCVDPCWKRGRVKGVEGEKRGEVGGREEKERRGKTRDQQKQSKKSEKGNEQTNKARCPRESKEIHRPEKGTSL